MACNTATALDDAKCLICLDQHQLLAIIASALCELSGGGTGGLGQVLQYTGTDPTSDGIFPTNLNEPAIAYKQDGSSATYVWNTVLQIWN